MDILYPKTHILTNCILPCFSTHSINFKALIFLKVKDYGNIVPKMLKY